ncbi:hypothetical protein [Oceanobacillus sojae]|uniref:hypothetical protein n=1 Tax=Oceanobacillus sojae TaxID=582851 RepID=UPI0021A41441|nr:hypothetical protein [Oceanobacillus sojae]MCT1904348.1 hypothetical protein [Oceanobacillus sojae]
MKAKNDVLYFEMYDLYFSREVNVLIMAFLLLFRTKSFNFHEPAYRIYLKKFPGKFIKILRVINIVIKLFLFKHGLTKTINNSTSVPYNGHILMDTSEGYKVFDLKKKLVITQYNEEYRGNIFEQIAERLKEVQKYGISNSVESIDYRNLCIYERYINLYKANFFYPFTTYFYQRIFPLWKRNITLLPSREVELKAYISNLENYISDSVEHYKNNNRKNLEVLNFIHDFTNELSSKLLLEENIKNVYLCQTHGDLHHKNMLIDSKSGVLIDCNTMKERSILHDLFFMYFYNLFKINSISLQEFSSKLDKCIEEAILFLQKRNNINIREKNFYRKLFYLEYIALAFEFNINIFHGSQRRIEEELDYFYDFFKMFEDAEHNITPLNPEVGNNLYVKEKSVI